MVCEIARIDYGNFKDSVEDKKLHDAYLRVWTDMAALQDPRPYSKPFEAPQVGAKKASKKGGKK